MALGRIGVLDLSIITDRLILLLNSARDNSPLFADNGGPTQRFSINVSGSMPETVRADGGCQMSLYLYHVAQDKNLRNMPMTGARGTELPDHPMALELYYLLTAFAGKDYVQEQQAMSIALKALHENPFLRTTVTVEGTPVPEEFVLSMEVETADKLGFQWQAFSTPFRLSAIYRVAVTFLTPPATRPPAAPKPRRVSVVTDPATLPFSAAGQIIGTERQVTYLSPTSTPANPDTRTFDLSPAVAAAGQTFLLWGAGLDQPTSSRIFLLNPDGTEVDITAWKSADAALQSASRVTLTVPAAAPDPGLYQLRAGSGTFRTNATPFSIAAMIPVGANPPVLADAAGLFTLNGSGFLPNRTEVIVGPHPLQAVAAAPSAGQFSTVAAGNVITFRLPSGIAPGLHPVRVRVNQVESAPSWWVNV